MTAAAGFGSSEFVGTEFFVLSAQDRDGRETKLVRHLNLVLLSRILTDELMKTSLTSQVDGQILMLDEPQRTSRLLVA
jgi:hypothetical protein